MSASSGALRSARLAAQAQRSAADNAPDDSAEQFDLAGLTILRIPNIDNIATVYTHAEERRAQLDQGPAQDTLVYYNATTAHLDALRSADPYGEYPGHITFFGDEIGLVFFRMTRPIHETAHLRLFLKINNIIVQIGLEGKFVATGSSEYKGTGTKKKEGDSGLLPRPPRWAGNHYPTLIIEAGNSESLPRLDKDKDWWFDNSPPNPPHGDVRIVLLVEVYLQTKRIVVEQWHRSFYQSATAKVIIQPHPHKPFSLHDSSHWVVDGAMVIPFQEVFLRPTQGQETDIVFTEGFFADMAMECWQRDTMV